MNPLWLVPILLLADQGLKLYVRAHFIPGWSVPLIPGVIDLTYLRNPGAAFGFLPGQTGFLVIISIAAVGAIIYLLSTLPIDKKLLRIGLSLGLTGAVGNLLDRVLYGYVVDMFDLSFWPGVFNIADLTIVTGVLLIIAELWKGKSVEEGAENETSSD